MGKAKIEHGWAIASRHGLYVGWRMTRSEAIVNHVHSMRLVGDPEVSQFCVDGKLSPTQKMLWNRHQKNGDYAVKVELKWRAKP